MTLRGARRMYQYRGNVLTTAPATEPVTADELRTFLSATSGQIGDTEANALIAMAREWIEEELGIAMIQQTWLVALDTWPRSVEPWWDGVRQMALSELSGARAQLDLPRFPLISVDDVTVYDDAGNSSAVVIANTFDVDTYRRPGRLALKAGAVWPVALRPTNAIEVTYKAGYGAASTDVPRPLRYAVTQLAGYIYDHRGCDMSDAYEKSGAKRSAGRYAVARL